MKQKRTIRYLAILPILAYLTLYALVSASFLTRFPMVHSDEAWLAGLTRDMQAAGSFGVTESVFDLKPRLPHAIKLLFHAIQMIYISLFGYSIQSVRLLSLTAGILCLILLYFTEAELERTELGQAEPEQAEPGTAGHGRIWAGAGLMILVSLDIPFIYASHFARQEILLCATMLACVLILLKCHGRPSFLQALWMAVITGLSVGIHPNSFLCAAVCVSVMAVCHYIRPHDTCCSLRPLLLYITVTGAIAMVFIGISFYFTPGFFPDYFRYGEQEFELSRTASGRISQFLYYFKSIFSQESGTYQIPGMRLELILIPVALTLLLLVWLFLRTGSETDGEAGNHDETRTWCGHTLVLLAAMAGLALGMVVIGRYNQTSIIFFILLGWICIFQLILLFERTGRVLCVILALVFLTWNSRAQIIPYRNQPSYGHFLEQLKELLPENATVIANLNTGFYFNQGMLLDYRNLPYVDGQEELQSYIRNNKIQYICLTDELDYIYENRPYYNIIYGNAAFIKELETYCRTCCTLEGSFENPFYGPRIISLTGNPDYGTVTVYKVTQDCAPAAP